MPIPAAALHTPLCDTPLCDLLGIRSPIPVQAQRVGFPAAIRAREQGDVDDGHAACGQSAGLIRGIEPAGEVIERMVSSADRILASLGR